MALGRSEAPFFGAPKKEKREKRRKGTPFFAVLSAGLGGLCGVYQQACPVDRLRLAWAGTLWRGAYTAFSPLRLCAWRRL
jgi:hypothetical protein